MSDIEAAATEWCHKASCPFGGYDTAFKAGAAWQREQKHTLPAETVRSICEEVDRLLPNPPHNKQEAAEPKCHPERTERDEACNSCPVYGNQEREVGCDTTLRDKLTCPVIAADIIA